MWSDALPVVVPAFGLAVLLTCSTSCLFARRFRELGARIEGLERQAAAAPAPVPPVVRYYPSPPPYAPAVYYQPPVAPTPSAPPANFPRLA